MHSDDLRPERLINSFVCLFCVFRSVANCLNEFDEQEQDDFDDVEMASIAEEEDLDEKFSHRGTSTGKISGRKKIVREFWVGGSAEVLTIFPFDRRWRTSSS
jgi:hypothetical protein